MERRKELWAVFLQEADDFQRARRRVRLKQPGTWLRLSCNGCRLLKVLDVLQKTCGCRRALRPSRLWCESVEGRRLKPHRFILIFNRRWRRRWNPICARHDGRSEQRFRRLCACEVGDVHRAEVATSLRRAAQGQATDSRSDECAQRSSNASHDH